MKGGRVNLSTRMGFRTVWVVESLPEGDRRTGKELYDDVLYYENVKDPEIYIQFRRVENRTGLSLVQREIKSTVKKTRQVPLLHLDTHGNTLGIQLKSGEFVRFEGMIPWFRSMNKRSQNNFFVVVAACHGAYLVQHINPTQPSPFWGICGPSEEIKPTDVVTGYQAFYAELFKTQSLNSALLAFNREAPSQANKVHIWNSEYLFRECFQKYLSDFCTPGKIEGRTQAMLAKARQ